MWELLLGIGFVVLLVWGVWSWACAQQAGQSADDYVDERRARWE